MSRRVLQNEIEINSSTAPAWAAGAVCYQIFPDRFCCGNPGNGVRTGEYVYGTELEDGPIPIEAAEWGSPVRLLDVGRFYGGDLSGILKKLPHLRYLGVEVLYLNPIFESPSNHKYDCSNYELVDPHLTTGDPETSNAWFAEFVKTCHEAGIRVILDGVFNHCSSSHPFFKDAKEDEHSPYRSWFSFDETGEAEYWWKVKTLPKFNYEGSKELENYILSIAAKWVSPPYNCDGWRLDVAADLGHSEEYNHSFWKRFRETVRKANPQALVLAEHYGDPSSWIRGGEWDTVMNYRGFMEPAGYYLTGMEKHSEYRRDDLYANASAWADSTENALKELGSPEAVFTAMNQMDNHDHSRMITRCTGKSGKLAEQGAEAASEGINLGLYKAAAVMLYTLPGMAALYYGDETGLPGWTDPDSRRSFPWDAEDRELEGFFAELGKLRKQDVLRRGGLELVSTGELAGPEQLQEMKREPRVLAYMRSLEAEKWLVLINPTGREQRVLVEAELKGKQASRILYTTPQTTSFGRKLPRVMPDGNLISRISGFGTKIYKLM